MVAHVIKAFDESADVQRSFARTYAERLIQVAGMIRQAFLDGHKLLLFGNGGSATDASHIAAEFVGRYHHHRLALPAIALTTDAAALTCIANDYTYTDVFARQIQALGRKGDIAVGISTSGNSPNVLRGVETAREFGLVTIGWTGGTGGKLADLVDHCFIVPSTVTARIQECHLTLGHALCEWIEDQVVAQAS